jgi:hypothetical protein
MMADAMRIKAAASMIATLIFVEITEAMRLSRAGTGACAVMERKAARGTTARGQAPLAKPTTVAMHAVVPPAEGPAWVAAVCAAVAVCAVAAEWAVECAAAGAVVAAGDIINSRDERSKAQFKLVYMHQNGDRHDVVQEAKS